MDKNLKFNLVEQLKDKYLSHDYIFIVNTSGLPSNASNTIRKQISGVNGTALTVKNTLNKIAIKNTKHTVVCDSLFGQNMSVFANDPVSVAKILVSYTKDENSGIQIIGVSDGKAFYGADYIKSLATMPSMEVIRASLLSVIQAVPTKIAYSLLYCPTAIGRVISSNFKSK